jgi:apolipoprotein N-acyltransferase
MIFKDLSSGWNRFALCLIFSFLMGLAFPPLQLGFLAYWGFLPLFFLLENITFKQAIKWGYLAGFLWNLATLYWIGWVTIPGLIGVLLVMPIYLSVYCWLHVLFKQKFGTKFIYLMPAVWVTIEFLKSLGSLGFPWTTVAYTQTYYTDLIQYASITGVYGVSFWIVLINVILFILVKQRRTLRQSLVYIIILLILFLIPFIYSKSTIPSVDESKENVNVSVIQGNVDPFLKWDDSFIENNFGIYEQASYLTESGNPDLIIWPETATACYLRVREDYLKKMEILTDSLNVAVLAGSPDFRYLDEGGYETYNGILFFQPANDEMQSYWKMHLVPFGERVPFEDSIPFLNNFFESLNMGTGDFAPGSEFKLFSMKFKNELLQIAGVICYESVFPDLVRKFVKMGGKLLVIITNDAWFGNTSGPYQHAQIAVFRAIENRISIARSANTGISSFIDRYGRVLAETKYNEKTSLTHKIPIREELTFYSIYGDVFAYLLSAVSGLSLVFSLFRWR